MSWREYGDGDGDGAAGAAGRLARFRRGLCFSPGMRRDALFGVADALACRPGRVLMLAELCLEPECRRGHGGLCDALDSGDVVIGRLRRALGAISLPAWDDGRIRLAGDVSDWLRPDAETSPERLFCRTCARGEGSARLIPGWPCSWAAALEPGRTSRALPLDAVRLGPEDGATGVTAARLRDVVARLTGAGHWKPGDPGVLVVLGAGCGLARLAFLPGGLPLEVPGRLRSDRVMYFPAPPRAPGANGRPSRHGAAFRLADAATWPGPDAVTRTETSRYGAAVAMARGRLRRQLQRRAAWARREGELPAAEGTLARLQADHLPGCRDAEPAWLWSSRAGTGDGEVNRTWQSFLRRFDIEHMFRFLKQQPGWARPRLRDPAAADRWTWLVIAACAQLHLARPLAADVRLPWQRPCPPGRLTPSRVRAGFRGIRADLPVPASAPEPSRPGPGRPAGSGNQRPATRHEVGKTVKRTGAKAKNQQAGSLNNKLRGTGNATGTTPAPSPPGNQPPAP